MSLAATFGVCLALLSSPASVLPDVRVPVAMQDAPPSGQEPAKPEPDVKPEQTQTPTPTVTPDSAPQAETPPPDPAIKPPEPSSTPALAPATKSSKSGHKPKSTPGDGTPSKIVVRNGSTADPTVQLSPGLSERQASRQLQSTDQLLESTDTSLKKMAGQQLKPGQKEMSDQIRRYMGQAKAALAAGDLNRAHNFAFKARLLADELAKSGK